MKLFNMKHWDRNHLNEPLVPKYTCLQGRHSSGREVGGDSGSFLFCYQWFNRSSLCQIYLIGEVVFCCDVFVFKNSLLVMNSFDQCKYSNCFPYWNSRRVLRQDSPSVRSGFGNLGEPAGLWTHFGNMGWFHGFNCIQFWFNCHSGSFL